MRERRVPVAWGRAPARTLKWLVPILRGLVPAGLYGATVTERDQRWQPRIYHGDL